MAALIPSASATGSGTMTLAGPSTNSNQTVNIPDATGTMMVSGNMPAFSAYRGSTQSVSSSTFTKVQINTEEFDTNNCFDSTTNYRFTPTVAGYYQLNGSISTEDSGGAVTRFMTVFYKNGSAFKRGVDVQVAAGIGYQSIVSALIYFNGTTDYVELYAYIAGISPAIRGDLVNTYFQASMARAA